MFTQLRIQNFKAWRDTETIRLAPLTVFFGPNSSGKTSLLQFLLLLKQTMESPDRKQVFNLDGSHAYINFGSWSEMVFGGDVDKGLNFRFAWQVPNTLGNEGIIELTQGKSLEFSAEIGPTGHSPMRVQTFGYRGVNPAIVSPAAEPQSVIGMRYRLEKNAYEMVPSRLNQLLKGRVLSAPKRFYGFPEEAPGLVVDDLELELERQLDSTQYLGPLRDSSDRLYAWSGGAPGEVGFAGENTIAALLAAQGNLLQLPNESEPTRLEVLLANWLVRIGLLESFEVKSVGSETSLYRIMVRTPGNHRQVNLADVGFGVSQVLPVLVQLLCAEPDTSLIFEQPEIHLHPKVQSELADLFIETLRMRQKGRPRNIQCLVESHSEHFLRRLQLRIADKTLTPDQVALYFCNPGPEGSTIEELQVDKYGRIANWPENFFGDSLGDTEKQMDVMLNRMEEEESNASG
ncbi:AAA ATPase domain-containing protein [Stigmatella aurantiaca]|uniref:AAA ATPase domain-containing protein n=1 Tax=Stigmatella aurantiaca TaxID=41 RepID=A0A1H7LVL6_STIAU|nr:DUF3696 domain-containing protein [Stigmatella aurantiaca]SEL03003.1 AAA ATPase domain-containing protein [Stigmatella aurantiaca]